MYEWTDVCKINFLKSEDPLYKNILLSINKVSLSFLRLTSSSHLRKGIVLKYVLQKQASNKSKIIRHASVVLICCQNFLEGHDH